MKKDYLRPEAEIINVEIGFTILNDSTTVDSGEPNQGLGTGKHRGDWGNIWGEEK